MNVLELLDRIKRGEDSETQFKEKINSPDALAAEISAFVNSNGGKIFVGVSDDGKIKGLSFEEVGKLNQLISNVCSQKLDPPISVMTKNISFEDQMVVVIDVPRGTNKFYMANGRDVWVKVGADKRRARREELQRLLQEAKHIYADEMAIEQTEISDLNIGLFERYIERRTEQSFSSLKLSKEIILQNLKLMKEGQCTLAGLLLFGKRPEEKMPNVVVKAVSFYGNDPSGIQYKDSRNLKGNIGDLYRAGIAFFLNQLTLRQQKQNFNSIGVLEIPKIALEEALVNALLHRNYLISSHIRLFVFDDRVEIISPGSLPNTVNVESIKFGIHIERNPILASLINDIEDIPYRGIGTGIQRILRTCQDAGVKVDLIDDKVTEQFKIVFWRNSGE
ncbi:MAG: putative DNA binding domain-containing protein [Halanaerobiales bacterium]|nr:putative DNA binding domain-containing protein [Halanaerobiales bacterium]